MYRYPSRGSINSKVFEDNSGRKAGRIFSMYSIEGCENQNLIAGRCGKRCDIIYVKGVSYAVQMVDRDLVFAKKNKIYVPDIANWVEHCN